MFTHDHDSPFPVLRHCTWKHLLRELEAGHHRALIKSGHLRMEGHNDCTANHFRLAPVVALAYLIAKSCSDIDRSPTLRVVVMAGEEFAIADGGRWYRLLGDLLGETVAIDFTMLLAPTMDATGLTDTYDASLNRALLAMPPSTSRVLRLADYLAEGHSPDILYIPFVPMADVYKTLLQADMLPELLARGTTLMGVNLASWAERDTALALFEANGVGEGEAIDSPYGLGECMSCPDDWSMGRYGWVVRPTVDEVADINWGRIAEITRFWGHFGGDLSEGHDNPHAGLWLQLGADRQGVLAGTRGRGVNLKTRQMYSVDYLDDGGHMLEHLGDVPNHFELDLPHEGMSRLDRAMYADHAMAMPLFPGDMKEIMQDAKHELISGRLNDFVVSSLIQGGYTGKGAQEQLEQLATILGGESGVEAGVPIFVAADSNNVPGIVAAVKAGQDPNMRDGEKWTPLCTAASCGATDAVTALVEAGARVNDPTSLGWRPIDLAINRGHAKTAIALLDAGAEIDNPPNPFVMNAQAMLRSSLAPASVLAWLAARGRTI
ncbi:ankyrin repeat domain-containing protein [Rhodanobacter sp. B2A1Ga4]|uniref:ankyrin repeat domain-containing protein n=1 Tax=Rhodanobacter sp. B2A1Ga4 TaxID=2778647 RepID=UPI001B36FAF2|nr:ankyrin repeat domain-containing protein [Rhodanobacter sp. B2A1Ga4]MBQ4855656.1 ankyrin repeat domain-containing protein [Rhodanobacter sp. B2A1Ga4]